MGEFLNMLDPFSLVCKEGLKRKPTINTHMLLLFFFPGRCALSRNSWRTPSQHRHLGLSG